MKYFVAIIVLTLLGSLDLVQANCEKFVVMEKIEELCEQGALSSDRKFANPNSLIGYYICKNNSLTNMQCDENNEEAFNPTDSKCTNIQFEMVMIDSICEETNNGQELAYFDKYSERLLTTDPTLKFPVSEYFVLCGTKPETPELKMCYGDKVKCIFNKDTKECEKKSN